MNEALDSAGELPIMTVSWRATSQLRAVASTTCGNGSQLTPRAVYLSGLRKTSTLLLRLEVKVALTAFPWRLDLGPFLTGRSIAGRLLCLALLDRRVPVAQTVLPSRQPVERRGVLSQ